MPLFYDNGTHGLFKDFSSAITYFQASYKESERMFKQAVRKLTTSMQGKNTGNTNASSSIVTDFKRGRNFL